MKPKNFPGRKNLRRLGKCLATALRRHDETGRVDTPEMRMHS